MRLCTNHDDDLQPRRMMVVDAVIWCGIEGIKGELNCSLACVWAARALFLPLETKPWQGCMGGYGVQSI